MNVIIKIGLLLFLILFVGCADKEDFSFNKNEQIKIPTAIINKIQGGEIILRKGQGYLSNLIVDLLGEDLSYSHAGILIKDSSGIYIIHSLSDDVSSIDGVQKCALNEFLYDVADSSLCIVKPLTDSVGLNLIQLKAKQYLKAGIPFDHNFDMHTKTELHCIELVHDILIKALNKELLPIKSRGGIAVVNFSSFFNANNFETIFELKPHSKSLN